MKYLNYIKPLGMVAIVSLLFTACDKAKQPQPMGDAGQTLVKIVNGGSPGVLKYAIDFVATPRSLVVADVRRDVPNNAELNKTMTVIVKDDTAALRAYDPSIIYLPNAWYTLKSPTPKTGGDGGNFTLTFAPGEFAKPIEITIPDATVLDPSETYGLAFTIMSADADGKVSVNRTIIVEIGAKNKYDGVYSLKSFHNRAPYQFPISTEMHMVTTGASTVRFYWPAAGGFGHPIAVDANNTLNWYGTGIGPAVVFDPVTNLVTDVYNAGSATAIRLALPPAAPVSRYDEASKTMYVYWYYFTGPNQDFSNRGWSDTLVYIGSR